MENTFEINEETMPLIRNLAEQMPGGFFIYHADGDEEFILINKAMLRITGCENTEQFKKLTQNSFKHFVHQDEIDEIEKSINAQIEKDEYNNDYVEYRIICLDGSEKWIRDYGHFTHTKEYGDVFYVFVDDSTERHKKEQELQNALEEQEAQLQEIKVLNDELMSLKETGIDLENKDIALLLKADKNHDGIISKEELESLKTEESQDSSVNADELSNVSGGKYVDIPHWKMCDCGCVLGGGGSADEYQKTCACVLGGCGELTEFGKQESKAERIDHMGFEDDPIAMWCALAGGNI